MLGSPGLRRNVQVLEEASDGRVGGLWRISEQFVRRIWNHFDAGEITGYCVRDLVRGLYRYERISSAHEHERRAADGGERRQEVHSASLVPVEVEVDLHRSAAHGFEPVAERIRVKCQQLGATKVFDKSNELDEMLGWLNRFARSDRGAAASHS